MKMEQNFENNAKASEPGEFEGLKNHFRKQKKKYIVGGLLVVGFVAGFYLGNRGNNKRHYQRLLKDGVKDAVQEGMRDLVSENMQDIVREGMYDTVDVIVGRSVKQNVKDAVKKGMEETSGAVISSIKDSVKDNVKNAVKKGIEGSAVTIVNTVANDAAKTFEDLGKTKKVFDYVSDNLDLMQLRTDAAGNIYKIKVTV